MNESKHVQELSLKFSMRTKGSSEKKNSFSKWIFKFVAVQVSERTISELELSVLRQTHFTCAGRVGFAP